MIESINTNDSFNLFIVDGFAKKNDAYMHCTFRITHIHCKWYIFGINSMLGHRVWCGVFNPDNKFLFQVHQKEKKNPSQRSYQWSWIVWHEINCIGLPVTSKIVNSHNNNVVSDNGVGIVVDGGHGGQVEQGTARLTVNTKISVLKNHMKVHV
jgi:hypothetical protein